VTLNFTALARDFALQVSDRRLTSVNPSGSVRLLEDHANKAVVLSCADAVLSVTYTGLGRLGTVRVDDWIADEFHNNAFAEMNAETALTKFALIATDWFRSFQKQWRGPHSFVFAGFLRSSESGRGQPRLWHVSNAEATDYLTFNVSVHTAQQVHVTGFLAAFTRGERRRMQAAAKNARNPGDLESALVAAIRNAASRPNGAPVGKNCMSVWLTPERVAVTRFHPEADHPSNYSPHIVWSEGGRNFVVRGVDVLSPGKYGVAFGGGASTIIVRPTIGPAPPSGELLTKFQIKFDYSRSHIGPITEVELVRFLDT
jgi:hypothetical protein